MPAPRTHSPVALGPFRVLVRELPTHKELSVDGAFVASVLAGLPMRDALGHPVDDPDAGAGVLDVELTAEGTHCFASGTMRGHVVVACGRCVSPARIDIDETVFVTFMPPGEMPAEPDADPEPEPGSPGSRKPAKGKGKGKDREAESTTVDEDELGLDPGALDVFPYDGEVVDLEPLIREHFVLAVPYAPLCKDDCKGLCPQCGIDRNAETCVCEPLPDPRFAALKGLKLPS